MKTRTLTVLSFILVLSMLLGACSAPTAAPTVAPADVQVQEKIVEKTVVVTQQVEVEKVVTSTPAPQGPVTITFWHAYNADVESKLLNDTIIPAFEAANPNIKVQAVLVPYDQFRRKLLVAMSGGTAPDLARIDILWTPELADQGALATLDQEMSDFSTYKDQFLPGPLSTASYNGHYYGLPLDTNTRVLVTNTDMFKAAGIENPPATIEDFLADCEKIKALGANKYCFADGGMYAWAVNPWIWSFGGDLTDPAVTKAIGFINGPDTVAAYNFLKDGIAKGYIHPGLKGGGVDAWGSFSKDEVAMLLEGPWFPSLFGSQFPDKKYSLALMPAGKGGSISVVGGENIVMFQQSQNKAAAEAFMKFMLSPEIQLKWAEAGQMPVLKSAIETDFVKNHAYFGIFLKQLETAKARTPHPNWSRMEEKLTNTGQAILNGGDTQALLDQLAKDWDPLLVPAQ